MTQDTRKDPRAKVLTMTVRYKSATLDEFIEHHSHDVSRGGMFIKTPSPFPPGTLLKFEVKIAGEQRVMQGVGRVVWKREAAEVAESRPAGMGVKFIKIDDESRKVIDQLVAARGERASAYEEGAEAGVPSRAPDAAPGATPAVVVPRIAAAPDSSQASSKPRKATMIGLGAMQKAERETPEAAAAEAFFPPTEPEKEMPAPEDRTVMRQAAELLQDALREAGGSLEEVGARPADEKREPPAVVEEKPKSEPATPVAAPVETDAAKAESAPSEKLPKVEPKKAEVKKAEPRPIPRLDEDDEDDAGRTAPGRGQRNAERSVIVNSRTRDEVTQPAVRRSSVAPGGRRSEPPRARPAAAQEAGAGADSGGGGRLMIALVAVAAAAGVVYFLTKPEPEMPQAPEPAPATEQAQPTPPPEPLPPEPAPEPTPAATGEQAPPVTPTGSVAPPTTTPPVAPDAPTARPAVKAPKPESPAPAAKPVQKPATQSPPAEPAAPPTDAADTTPKPAPAPAKPKPKPAPKPAPKESGDNPY